MQVTVDASEILKTVLCDLTFILNVLPESSIHFVQLSIVIAKKRLSVSHKSVFIENKPVLLCVTTM